MGPLGRWRTVAVHAGAVALAVTWSACRSPEFPEVEVSFDGGLVPVAAESAGPGAARVVVAAMLSPEDTYSAYAQLLAHLSREMNVPLSLTQRRSYREANELLVTGRIDVAFVCTGGYAELLARGEPVEVLAVPVARGEMTYRSLIIVPASSSATQLADLAGRRFAFTDELSLSGYAYPSWAVRQQGLDPKRFFAVSYFTHSHDRSIRAVAQGLVDGAAVDGLIFDELVARNPGLGRAVRVIHRSEALGIPPVVALKRGDPALRRRFREALLSLHETEAGRALLRAAGFERFSTPRPGLYDSALTIMGEVLP
ncbi:MAG: phosphate/phosphite/phosphonate ABC transporter substrate-binding protein [Myxococcota bacterium]|jgi:phosphonate transport system substrate-binding protein